MQGGGLIPRLHHCFVMCHHFFGHKVTQMFAKLIAEKGSLNYYHASEKAKNKRTEEMTCFFIARKILRQSIQKNKTLTYYMTGRIFIF
jgi:hypothetical protein